MAGASSKTIGGREYSFGTIPATQAVEVEVAVAKVIGEPLFKAFTEGGVGETKEEFQKAGMLAMGLMATKMDAKELLNTMTTCFKYVTCDGKRINSIDESFTGRNRELWEVFLESLRYNFSDFLPEGLSPSLRKVMHMG